MRIYLKNARIAKGLTQQQMADELDIGLRYYKSLESGERLGSIDIWDRLEDITGIHQRVLREILENHPDQEDSQ
ncbi:MAG: helix-turn-helix transcriptional regulator [Clostridiales bacterium]|jgi:transcriptional regulator with XRE-family HTH domain|nr:helix-turn-helix transcriptional regulator [Clostridiales bacterium]